MCLQYIRTEETPKSNHSFVSEGSCWIRNLHALHNMIPGRPSIIMDPGHFNKQVPNAVILTNASADFGVGKGLVALYDIIDSDGL